MNVGKTLFAQIMAFVPWTSFSRIVQRYSRDSGVRRLTCSEQFRLTCSRKVIFSSCLSKDLAVERGMNLSASLMTHCMTTRFFASPSY
jgi:hypothetical protein